MTCSWPGCRALSISAKYQQKLRNLVLGIYPFEHASGVRAFLARRSFSARDFVSESRTKDSAHPAIADPGTVASPGPVAGRGVFAPTWVVAMYDITSVTS